MEYKDYYKILGVAKTASDTEIKKAYRKLARKYHPDISKETDAAQRMAEINEANEVLTNKDKRTAYDQLGDASQFRHGFSPPPNWNRSDLGGFEAGDVSDSAQFSSFFEGLFGNNRQGGFSYQQQRHSTKGKDKNAEIELSIPESYSGVTRKLQIKSIEKSSQGFPIEKINELEVTIPKGIYAGQSIRLAGKGEPGVGSGAAGDLLLKVRFTNDKRWSTQGKDVYQIIEITPWQAALGGVVTLHTLAGTLEVNIASGTKANSKLRVKGKGLPARQAGDLYLVVHITAPTPVTDAQRQAYATLAKAFQP